MASENILNVEKDRDSTIEGVVLQGDLELLELEEVIKEALVVIDIYFYAEFLLDELGDDDKEGELEIGEDLLVRENVLLAQRVEDVEVEFLKLVLALRLVEIWVEVLLEIALEVEVELPKILDDV